VAVSIEEGETAWQTALRELYEADRDAITIAPVFVAFIDSAEPVTLIHEHSEYRWLVSAKPSTWSRLVVKDAVFVGSKKSLQTGSRVGTF